MTYRKLTIVVVFIISLIFPVSVMAEDDLIVSVETVETCGDAAFEIGIQGGEAPYRIVIDFGDDANEELTDVFTIPHIVHHMYPSQGEFEYSVKVIGVGGTEGEIEGVVVVAGPDVTLESDPSPPLLPLGSEGTKIDFTAIVTGGKEPYAFEWDLNEDGVPDEVADSSSNTATFTFTEADKLEAKVKVTDSCGFSGEDELKVYIIDPTAEEEPDVEEGENTEEGEDISGEDETKAEKGCHPTAQRLSDLLMSLSSAQREGEYNCENIFNFFQGEEGGLHHSFGLLWRAYQMTQIIDELTWEDILDWHLQGSGWGGLQQLNRLAASLEEVSITELYQGVMSGENTIGDIRNAARAALRFEADFRDALERLESGTSRGELNQLYRTALEMEIDPTLLDDYMEMGVSLSQIKHASKLAGQTGSEWQILLGAYTSGYEWAEIRKAFRLADDPSEFETILAIGADAYREQQRELERADREGKQNEKTAKRLAEQYGVEEAEILELLNSPCEGDWKCVREHLRQQALSEGTSDHDQKTALQIAEKYGVAEEEVWEVYNGTCDNKWSCVRGYFRDQTR